jgi:molybdate transport system regulatory protein
MSPGKKRLKLAPRFKLWLSSRSAEGVFGDGKWRLLKAIQKQGSLKAAAKTLRMSYRKAWGDLRKAERHLGVTLVSRQRGGTTGGGTELTEAGKKWLKAYSRLRADAEKVVAGGVAKHINKIL